MSKNLIWEAWSTSRHPAGRESLRQDIFYLMHIHLTYYAENGIWPPMKNVEIYDPALCCSSGICGPSPDRALAAFAGTIEKLKACGATIKRFNLAQEPLAFAQNPEVKAVLEKQGEGGLPLVFVAGELRFSGRYPSQDQLASALGMAPQEAGCCDLEEDSCCETDSLVRSASENQSEPLSFVKVDAPSPSESKRCCDPSAGCC